MPHGESIAADARAELREAEARRQHEATAEAEKAARDAQKAAEKQEADETAARERAAGAAAEAEKARQAQEESARLAREGASGAAEEPGTLSAACGHLARRGHHDVPAGRRVRLEQRQRDRAAGRHRGLAAADRAPRGTARRRARRRLRPRPDPARDHELDMADTTPTSELGQAVHEVTERAQVLIQEEIALAKTEVTEKVTELGKGAPRKGIVAAIFALFGLIFLLHALAFGASGRSSAGATTTGWASSSSAVLLLVLAVAVGALLGGGDFIQKGGSPTPQMAIDEAQLIRQTITTAREAGPAPPVTPVTPAPTASPREVDRT